MTSKMPNISIINLRTESSIFVKRDASLRFRMSRGHSERSEESKINAQGFQSSHHAALAAPRNDENINDLQILRLYYILCLR
jgi:hypothetical protein